VPTRDITQADVELHRFYAFAKPVFDAYFPDFVWRLTTVYRSPSEQLVEFTSHRSNCDGVEKVSGHNVIPTRAIDGGIFRKSDGAYIDTIPDFPDSLRKALYAFIGLLAELHGLRWGADWNGNGVPVGVDRLESLNDPYHIEKKAAK